MPSARPLGLHQSSGESGAGPAPLRDVSITYANFFTTDDEIGYGEAISGLTNGSHLASSMPARRRRSSGLEVVLDRGAGCEQEFGDVVHAVDESRCGA